MRNRDRSSRRRFGRTLILVIGVLGGFAALDAILLVPILLLAVPNPYVGLLTLVALPLVAVGGGALAWTAFTLLTEAAGDVEADGHEVQV